MLVYKGLSIWRDSEILDLDKNILCRFVIIRKATGQTQAPSRQAMTFFSAVFTIIPSFFYKDWQVTNIFCCYCQQLGVRDSIFAVQGAVYIASSIPLYLHWTCLALLMEYLISCSILSDNCFSCLISCCSIQNTETEKLFSPCYKTSLIFHICHTVSKL